VNIAQLREVVTELLSASPDLIGFYTLPNGSTLPAVYVVGRQSVPNEWKVKGLEVTIEEFASVSPRAMVGKVQNNKQWTVVLIDYTTTSDALQTAAARMARRFPDAQFSFRPESDVVYGQYRIRIPDTELLNLYPAS
jgi:ribonucleotide monophosphatase NagD (HAD superfamily)